jgi:hypothetical protein
LKNILEVRLADWLRDEYEKLHRKELENIPRLHDVQKFGQRGFY